MQDFRSNRRNSGVFWPTALADSSAIFVSLSATSWLQAKLKLNRPVRSSQRVKEGKRGTRGSKKNKEVGRKGKRARERECSLFGYLNTETQHTLMSLVRLICVWDWPRERVVVDAVWLVGGGCAWRINSLNWRPRTNERALSSCEPANSSEHLLFDVCRLENDNSSH